MKNILVLLLLFLGTTTLAQKGGLSIEGLNDDAKAVYMELKKAIQTSPQTYRVIKLKDVNSQKLTDAVASSQRFDKAFISLIYDDGKRMVMRLTNVYLSDISSKRNGRNATEQFTIHFETSQPEM